ncbi:glutamine amidotransferase-related protein [Balneatrix alpica]|uniref:GMP synthase n=1 Tax=Balneatrix alpica TaxID=75684 RepID=A0ABV5ZEZ0_9GAMM|nr:glutamine amidotransferase [Balneatrix alpica]
MKIGILQCDDVMESLQSRHGNYPEMIENLLREQQADIEVAVYRVLEGQLPSRLDECDAYITTGSRYGVNDGDGWISELEQWVRQLFDARIPLVGICFGHQLVAKALGGKVVKSDKGWGVGVSFNQVLSPKPWMEPFQSQLDLVVSHQDQVSILPPQAEVLAASSFCPYYLVQYGEHFLTVQGHPEFCKDYSCDLMDARRDRIPANRIREGMASLAAEVDDRLMMRWVMNFYRHALS